MNYKKYLICILCLGLLFTFAGCGTTKQEQKETDTAVLAETASVQDADVPAAASTEEVSGTDSQDDTSAGAPEGGILTFRDVFGTEFEVEIDTDAAANPYDPALFRHEGSFVVYDGTDYSSVPGIDVSAYQGEIDWPAVKAQGIEFVIVRLGYRGYGPEGTLVEDEMALANIEAAKAAGLAVGVYFFSQAVTEAEAIEEADYVTGILSGVQLELPVVYDVENIRDDEARTDNVEGAQFTKNAAAFCEQIKAVPEQK